MRKITAMTSLISFVLLVLTSVVLYITPEGRVANWADWRLWGLSKEQWTSVHVNLGFLFLIAIFLHIYYNWKPITAYMKNKARSFKLFTPAFNTGLIVSAVVTVGTLLFVPPFSSVIEFSDSIKADAAKVWGEPPYGHAELSSLSTFASKMDYDLNAMLAQLDGADIEYENASQTLLDVAHSNGISPQALYLIMRPDTSGQVLELPATSPEGLGNLTVAEFSQKYGLNQDQVLEILKVLGLEATAETKFREMSEAAGTNSADVYMLLIERLAEESGDASSAMSESSAAGDQAQEAAPTGLGRMTLEEVCAQYGFDLDQAVAKLAENGMQAAAGDKVRDIAAQAGLTPEDVYLLLR